MKNKVENLNVYIGNLQACDIYDHMFKGKVIELTSHAGMLPYSIELRKLEQEGLKPKKDANGKRVTHKIINVKFSMNVQAAKKQIPKLNKSLGFHKEKLAKLDEKLATCSIKRKARLTKLINETKQDIENIEYQVNLMTEQQNETHMREMKRDKLRQYLYENGFALNGVKFLPYKRSSAKSRKGEMIFIVDSLHKKMMKWSRMGIDFTKHGEIDYPSLLAYESLIMSSILQDENGLIKIEPKNMLIISDMESTFKWNVNVVRKSEKDGYLEAVPEYTDVTNSIWDGQSLLDSQYFRGTDTRMKQLRNHFFKTCSFSCNIQQFLKDNCPDDINYEDYEIKNLFGETVKASDVHFIFCESSLKALKFADMVSSKEKEIDRKNDMYKHWVKIIENEGSLFGVCKLDKSSKLGEDATGNTLQQTTYQFLNSLPLENEQLDDLLVYETSRIDLLKNDYEYFIDYVEKNATVTNANSMMVDLYRQNPNIVHSEVFRTFKSKTVNAYVERVKKGKIKIPNADYATICSNPIEMLKFVVNKFDIENRSHISDIALKGNQIYCPLFEDGDDLVCWRNPHTSQSNVLISKNCASDDVKKYMKLSSNIVIVNCINFPLQPILSGSDQDGDTMAIVKNETLLEASRECYEKYNVSINRIPSSKKKYDVTYGNAAVIDNSLANNYIGRVVNENQHILSLYWHRKAKGVPTKVLNHLLEQIDKFTILSEICIDMAKKKTDIDIDAEIDRIKELVIYNTDDEGKKRYPLFFKLIKGDKKRKQKFKTSLHQTTMDKLFVKMNNLKYADKLEDKPFEDFLIKYKLNDANREQRQTIEDITNEKIKRISEINQGGHEKDEKNRLLEDTTKSYQKRIRNLNISPETMYSLLLKVAEPNNGLKTTLLNILYNHDKEAFLNAFKKMKKATEMID